MTELVKIEKKEKSISEQLEESNNRIKEYKELVDKLQTEIKTYQQVIKVKDIIEKYKYSECDIITEPPLKVATDGSAGHELLCIEDILIESGEQQMIDINVKLVSMPKNMVMKIMPKSGHATKGIDVLAGVIDSDYRNNIRVILINHGSKQFKVNAGKSIAQAVFLPIYHTTNAEFNKQTILNHTGFGSTNS